MAFLWQIYGEESGDRNFLGSDVTFQDLTGNGSMVGVTELADVSDPPRKYRVLQPNHAGFYRAAPGLAILQNLLKQRVHYTTAGVRNDDLYCGDGPPETAAEMGPAVLLTYEEIGSNYNLYAPDWTGLPPLWTKASTRKDFAAFTPAPGETAPFRGWGAAWGRVGGVQGTSRGLSITYPVWMGTYWLVNVTMAGDGVNLGTAQPVQTYVRMLPGNQDPGAAGLTDYYMGQSPPVPASSGSSSITVALAIPPDTSATFFVWRPGSVPLNPEQFPDRPAVDPTNDPATDADLVPWLYFPAAPGDLAAWNYAEGLRWEDTPWDALLRGGFVPGTGSVANTTVVGGGVTAESHAPINITMTVVQATRTVTGLTPGNLYQYTATMVDNLIGGGPAIITQPTQEIEAAGASQVVTFQVVAPLGYERRCVVITAASLGPAPAPPPALDTDTMIWWGKVLQAGGTITSADLLLADALVTELKAQGLWTSLTYFLPLIGQDLTAALIPLRDRSSATGSFGPVTNMGFVPADYTPAGGLVGDGVKYLLLPLASNQAGAAGSGNGGLGFWSMDAAAAPRTPIGNFNVGNTSIFSLDQRPTLCRGQWNTVGSGAHAEYAQPAPAGFFYAQRSSATARELWIDGASVAANVINNTPAFDATPMVGWGRNQPSLVPTVDPYPGPGFALLVTTGVLTSPQVTALYNTLLNFLATPLGR